jgi:type VI secretion system protein ImpH
MGNPNGNAAADLDSESLQATQMQLPDDVRSYNFFQLVELLHKLQNVSPESEEWELACKLVFSANPSLGFSPADVTDLTERKDGRLVVQTNFFGLSGAQSPLPGFMIEQLVEENEGGYKRPFFDFFNNRLISLVYRIWRKYRYYVRFEEGAEDAFSQQLFALVGLGDVDLRGDTPVNWCKMLAYSGMLAGRSRSPQVVAGIIAHCFDLDDVSIRQWERRQVPIDPSQQFCLGKQNGQLGVDTVIGDTVADCNGKFVICIKELTRQRFTEFLPSGKEYPSLCHLVELILREQMAYDIELTMDEDEIPALRLDSQNGVALGWYSFLGHGEQEKSVRIQVRQ